MEPKIKQINKEIAEHQKQIVNHQVGIHFLILELDALEKQLAWEANHYRELYDLNQEEVDGYFERNQDSVYL